MSCYEIGWNEVSQQAALLDYEVTMMIKNGVGAF